MAGAGARERVPFVGLTGGMAAGKSEALNALERLGAATLSTDAVVRELLAADEARDELVARLGPEVAPEGAVDRDAVASLVFERPDERVWLEGYLWPRVGERVAAWREEVTGRKPAPRAAVVEVPLLFESGMESVFDHTIAVIAGDEVRTERIGGRGHTGVGSREARQLSQADKAERADFVVRNDGTLDELRLALSGILERIEA
jgi:dephospho-CoA kinase